jgi:hypothetical protein
MALKPVNLDDRRYQELLEAAIARARQSCPSWTDFSAGDPGRVLLELFSYLTEVMIYRLNRLPEKAYVEFLRLLGVQLRSPTAAVATLEFKLKAPRDAAVEIPRNTRVVAAGAAAGGDPPVFITAETVKIAAGATTATVRAYHCERIEAELVGKGTGFPGQTYAVRRPPIIAPTDSSVDIFVGVEATPKELEGGVPMVRHEGKTFRIWQERQAFADAGDDEPYVYVLDRVAGTITFAPALRLPMEDGGLAQQAIALAAVPREDRDIRVWYCTGGGPAGNVAAGTLTKLKDPLPGVEVENPTLATGGRSAETLEHALRRGPEDLHSLRRAVTAGDFETLALRAAGGVSRARAYTKHQLWKYAPRGTVEVVCLPYVPPERIGAGPVTAKLLGEHESAEVLEQVHAALDRRRPLGTECTARWGKCKKVRVKARVVVYSQEDKEAVRARVLQRLYDAITPIERTPEGKGWEFGVPLSAYDVYRVLSSEPGVRYVDPIKLCVDDVPSAAVTAMSPDAFQPATWYAASGDAVFRTSNGGNGWERIARIEDSTVRLLEGYPREAGAAETHAGLLAAIAEFDEGKSRVYLSRDCGESWTEIGARPEFRIEDMAWTDRDGEPLLLLATGKGLYELATHEGAKLTPILVDPKRVDLGFYSVVVSTDPWGQSCVAVAAQGRAGVYLSSDNGKPGTFGHIGLKDEKVRTLAVQHFGAQRYLWAGMDAAGDDAGNGCSRWQLPESPEGWESFGKGWKAGGCLGLAFLGSTVLAGTRRHGVVRLDIAVQEPTWSAPDVGSGLPMAELDKVQTIDFVAAAPGAAGTAMVLAASAVGIYRSADQGAHYEHCSQKEFADRVTLPETWLFCSDQHDIEVKHDEAL